MDAYARLIADARASWAIIALTVLLGVVSVVFAGQVERDDDVLKFLPEGNPDIETFYGINDKFGGLEVALIGIESDNPFDPAFLEPLQKLTKAIDDTAGVDYVLSLTSVEDFTVDPVAGGIVTANLVSTLPKNDAEQQALRAKVMSRDHVVGNLIAPNGKGVLVYVFAAHGTDTRELAVTVRGLTEEAFPDSPKYWGGAPFVSTYIYDTTDRDMAKLTPWAVVAIVVIILLSFRDIVGSILALVTTGLGIVVSRAAMAAMGVPFNIVLSAMPVIMFAVGSAYSIHMLSRYYANRALDEEDALRITIVDTAPVVVAAGLTTVAGIGSFVMMDIAPMRTFGLFTGLGIFTTLVLSVSFVPAVIRVVGLRGPSSPHGRWMIPISKAAHDNPVPFGVGLVVVGLIGAIFVGQVDNRMDQTAFFAKGSEPDEAARFLDEHFGGSQFLQIHIKGDLSKPEGLRELRRLSDVTALHPLVTQVNHVGVAVSTVNDAMEGIPRIPDTPQQVGTLYGFLAGNPSVKQLVTDERDEALVHVKIGSNTADALEEVVQAVEVLARDRAPETSMVEARVLALSRQYGVSIDASKLDAALAVDPGPTPPDLVKKGLRSFLGSEENWVPLEPAQIDAAVQATVGMGPKPDEMAWGDALHAAFLGLDIPDPTLPPPSPESLKVRSDELRMTADDLVLSAQSVVDGLWREAEATHRAEALLTDLGASRPEGDKGARYVRFLAAALTDLGRTENAQLELSISGLPVLYRGLSISVTNNQFKSLAMALGLVFVIMTVLFRSPASGLLATAPTALTLLVVYGGMGFMGVHLDIGTSMLGSIIIGAGVDYAVHLLSAWRGATVLEGLEQAVDDTAPAIWTNAIMVAAGFFILTLGEAKPLQNVGGLTSAAMIVAAVASFLAIPVLARRASYRS